jgi:hypothetical protein
VELLSPARELATLLQRYRTDLDNQQRATDQAVADTLSIAVEQAVLVFHLATTLRRNETGLANAGLGKVHKQLRVLHDQMQANLADGELCIRDPVGAAFRDVADVVDVVGWRHSSVFVEEVVAETIEPVVLHRGRMIRQGRVVMGAPNDPEPSCEPATNEPYGGNGEQST